MTRAIFFLFVTALPFIVGDDVRTVTQIHMAQGRDPTSMTISWVTPLDLSHLAASEVHYGTSPTDLSFTAVGYSSYYTTNYVTQSPYTSGQLHHAVLTTLLPGTTYYYSCGDFSDPSSSSLSLFTSGIQSFKTLPAVGSNDVLTFGIVGDLGQTGDSLQTVMHLLTAGTQSNNPVKSNRAVQSNHPVKSKRAIDMILHAGDLSYADCVPTRWDSYALLIEPLSSTLPWMVGPGNHELEVVMDGSVVPLTAPSQTSQSNPIAPSQTSQSGVHIFTAFESRYRMPAGRSAEIGDVSFTPGSGGGAHWTPTPSQPVPPCGSSVFLAEYEYGNSYYSFDAGLVHVVFLNPYAASDMLSSQYQFLLSDLSRVNRQITPWIVVVMHCPWYNSNKSHKDEWQTTTMKSNLETMLANYHVNVVFAGHVHAYERTFPVLSGQVSTDQGIVYLTIGAGGNHEGHSATYDDPSPSWSAYRDGLQFGHGELSVLSSRSMTWAWKRNIDGEAVAVDSVVICNRVIQLADGDTGATTTAAFGTSPADCGDGNDDNVNDDYSTTNNSTGTSTSSTSSSSSTSTSSMSSSSHKGLGMILRERNRALTAALAALVLLVVSMMTLAMVFVCLRWQQVKRVLAQGLGLGLGLEGGSHPGHGLEEGLGPDSVEERERETIQGDEEMGRGSRVELATAPGPGLAKEGTIAYVSGLGKGLGKDGRMLLPSDEIEEEKG